MRHEAWEGGGTPFVGAVRCRRAVASQRWLEAKDPPSRSVPRPALTAPDSSSSSATGPAPRCVRVSSTPGCRLPIGSAHPIRRGASERTEGLVVVWPVVGALEALTPHRLLGLGQVAHHVLALVPLAPLDQGPVPEGLPDGRAEPLAAIVGCLLGTAIGDSIGLPYVLTGQVCLVAGPRGSWVRPIGIARPPRGRHATPFVRAWHGLRRHGAHVHGGSVPHRLRWGPRYVRTSSNHRVWSRFNFQLRLTLQQRAQEQWEIYQRLNPVRD